MKKNKKGFTLAEIIISMSIIGIIAAITIPALLTSTSEKALEAQKKALLARVSQAMSQIDDLRVYGKTDEDGKDSSSAINFITKGLSKVYRINKACDETSISSSCLFPEEVTKQDGTTFTIAGNTKLSTFLGVEESAVSLDTTFAGFVTANDESIVLYYNPNCWGERINGFYKGSATTAMCLNMIYDLNGKDSAPNEVGKDVGFLTVFFPKDPDIASPITYSLDADAASAADYKDMIDACKKQNRALILPTWTDGMAIAINRNLIGNISEDKYIVSGAGSTNQAYEVNMGSFNSSSNVWGSGYKLRCIYNW